MIGSKASIIPVLDPQVWHDDDWLYSAIVGLFMGTSTKIETAR